MHMSSGVLAHKNLTSLENAPARAACRDIRSATVFPTRQRAQRIRKPTHDHVRAGVRSISSYLIVRRRSQHTY